MKLRPIGSQTAALVTALADLGEATAHSIARAANLPVSNRRSWWHICELCVRYGLMEVASERPRTYRATPVWRSIISARGIVEQKPKFATRVVSSVFDIWRT